MPRFKLDFEYDGFYWHKNTKERDNIRDIYLNTLGWKVIRIQEEIDKEINKWQGVLR